MRAARLLHLLLLLQNRGRLTSAQLAQELEVSRRTILRDVDAMTEAGLPVIVHQGNQGGIELGFDYRSRLTGLSAEEAEALGVILTLPLTELDAIGLGPAGRMALSKLRESLPGPVRQRAEDAAGRFRLSNGDALPDDPRIPAMADAVRGRNIVRLRARSGAPLIVHPAKLCLGPQSCDLIDALTPDRPLPLSDWGDINISAKTF